MKKINLFALFITLFSAGCAAMAEEATTSQAKRHHATDRVYTQQEVNAYLNQPQPCPFCKNPASSTKTLARHIRRTCSKADAEAQRNSFFCPICLASGKLSKRDSHSHLMGRHINPIHCKITKQCQACGKVLFALQHHRCKNRQIATVAPAAATSAEDIDTPTHDKKVDTEKQSVSFEDAVHHVFGNMPQMPPHAALATPSPIYEDWHYS